MSFFQIICCRGTDQNMTIGNSQELLVYEQFYSKSIYQPLRSSFLPFCGVPRCSLSFFSTLCTTSWACVDFSTGVGGCGIGWGVGSCCWRVWRVVGRAVWPLGGIAKPIWAWKPFIWGALGICCWRWCTCCLAFSWATRCSFSDAALRRILFIELTLGTLLLSQTPSLSKLFLISHAKMHGFSSL